MLFKDQQKKEVTTTDPRLDRSSVPQPERERTTSFIGQSVRLEGMIEGEDDVTIEGRFKGDVRLKKSLFVGIEGFVEADVQASSVTIAGHITGTVAAETRVKILDSGVMDGSLSAPKIIIAEGGQLRGQVNQSER